MNSISLFSLQRCREFRLLGEQTEFRALRTYCRIAVPAAWPADIPCQPKARRSFTNRTLGRLAAHASCPKSQVVVILIIAPSREFLHGDHTRIYTMKSGHPISRVGREKVHPTKHREARLSASGARSYTRGSEVGNRCRQSLKP